MDVEQAKETKGPAEQLFRQVKRLIWRAVLFVAAVVLVCWMLLHAHVMRDDFTWYGLLPIVGLLACFVLYSRSTRNEIIERIDEGIAEMRRSMQRASAAKKDENDQ